MAALDKVAIDPDAVLGDIPAGATVLVGGFGDSGVPFFLLESLARTSKGRLTVVSNNCGTGESGLALLFKHRLVAKILASFPTQPGNHHFQSAIEDGSAELHLVPQGTLVERLHAGAAGLGGVLTPTGVDTLLAAGKATCSIEGRRYLLEMPISGDVALVRAAVADQRGNLRYRRAARNFNAVMAKAARFTIAEVDQVVPVGAIDPDDVHTSGAFVDAVVVREAAFQ